MRILTFLHSFEPGGVERDALRLNDAWHKAGHEAHIVLGRAEGPLAAEAPVLPYHILQKGRWSTQLIETLFMIWHLPQQIRAIRPDVIFCAGNTYTVVAVVMRLVLGRRCPPMVLRVSNDLRRADMIGMVRWFYHRWLKLQAPVFAAIVGMAEPARAEIIDYMQPDTTHLAIINNASIRESEIEALASARRAHHRLHEGRRFLAVGRLAAQKNFTLLIKAFAAMVDADDRLTIVGEGPERPKLERLVKRLGIGDKVTLAGHINPLDAAFAGADVFVLSSDYEGLGVVVVEALAAGIPIVATDCCVNMEMLVDGAGVRVPTRNIGALSYAMVHAAAMVVDPAKLRARAEAFSVEATASHWIDLFETVEPARFQGAANLAKRQDPSTDRGLQQAERH